MLTHSEEIALEAVLPVESLENLKKAISEEAADQVIFWAEEKVRKKTEAKAVRRAAEWEAKTLNRVQYTPQQILRVIPLVEEDEDGVQWKRCRVTLEESIRCMGLMEHVIEEITGSALKEPAAMYMRDHSLMPQSGWDLLDEETGLLSSKGRLVWNTASPAWEWMQKMFPVSIDVIAYGHSLMAPLIPKGFMPGVNVTFARLEDREGTAIDADGSGVYHPDAPEMRLLIQEYGTVAFQFRLIHDDGTFAKGMLFPSELATNTKGEPAIMVDWLQIKGHHKSNAKIAHKMGVKKNVTGCYIGILRARVRATKLNSCFEILENIQRNEHTEMLVRSIVQKAMRKMAEEGPEKLLARAASADPNLKYMVRLIKVISKQGYDISPLQIERIQAAVRAALGKQLYRIAQGGGIMFKAFEARMDATVPVGKCVVAELPMNVEVAITRLPMVQASGLMVLKTTHPSEHHIFKTEGGKSVCPGTIILNPADISKIQGDDDGDTIGVSIDKDIIELFKNRLDDKVYHIEGNSGERIETPTNSPEGHKLMRRSQRGEVGLATWMRAALLAVGDKAAANGMSLIIQESVDRAKKIVRCSNVFKAANITNWRKDENGELWFDHKLSDEECPMGEIPVDKLFGWVQQRIIKAGCYTLNNKGQVRWKNPLTWRQKTRQIDPLTWRPCQEEWEGNLVHFSHDCAWEEWQEISKLFDFEKPEVDLENILYMALEAKGIALEMKDLNQAQTTELLRKSGLENFRKNISNVLADKTCNQREKLEVINLLQLKLENSLKKLTMEDQLNLWRGCHIWGPGTTTAMRAVCWEGSPILVALGITDPMGCDFLTHEKRVVATNKCLESDHPTKRMLEMALLGTKHQEAKKDEDGEGIPIWKCPECMQRLQMDVVNGIRLQVASHKREWLNRTLKMANAYLKTIAIPLEEEKDSEDYEDNSGEW